MNVRHYPAAMLSLYDADTLTFSVDVGFELTLRVTGRLRGVNAPELPTEAGKAARKWVISWLQDGEVLDGPRFPWRLTTRLVAGRDQREKYGRYLIDVQRTDGRDLATDLIAAGHAVPYMIATVDQPELEEAANG